MWESPLSLGVVGVLLTLLLGLIAIGVGIMNPPVWIAKVCFSCAAIVFLWWIGWVVRIYTAQSSAIIRWGVIFLIFGLIGIGWNEALRWIENRQASLTQQQPIMDVKIYPSMLPLYPLREYALMIQNLNPKSAVITDCRIEFNFRNIIVEINSRLLLPTGGDISVEGLEIYEQKQNRTKPLYKEKPPETSMDKIFSLAIRQAEINGKTVNTNFLLFTCSGWPEKAAFAANIIVDLLKESKKLKVQKKLAMAGTYEGEYFYEINGKKFSQTISGSIANGDDKK